VESSDSTKGLLFETQEKSCSLLLLAKKKQFEKLA